MFKSEKIALVALSALGVAACGDKAKVKTLVLATPEFCTLESSLIDDPSFDVMNVANFSRTPYWHDADNFKTPTAEEIAQATDKCSLEVLDQAALLIEKTEDLHAASDTLVARGILLKERENAQ